MYCCSEAPDLIQLATSLDHEREAYFINCSIASSTTLSSSWTKDGEPLQNNYTYLNSNGAAVTTTYIMKDDIDGISEVKCCFTVQVAERLNQCCNSTNITSAVTDPPIPIGTETEELSPLQSTTNRTIVMNATEVTPTTTGTM